MSSIRKAGALLFLILDIIFFILLLVFVHVPCYYLPLVYFVFPALISLLLLAYLAYPSKPKETPRAIKVILMIFVLSGFCIPIGTVAMIFPTAVMEMPEFSIHFWAMGILALFSFKKDIFEKMKKGSKGIVLVILTAMVTFPAFIPFTIVVDYGRLDFQITDAKLIVVDSTKKMQIEIWNTGSIDITSLKIEIGTFSKELGGVHAGEKRSFAEDAQFEENKPNIIKVIAEGSAPCGGTRKIEKIIIVSPIKI